MLLDVMMPRMSGFEVCRKLKDNPATRGIPVMMVTALNDVGDIERGVESGTDDFVSKPVNKLELVTRVKSLLQLGPTQAPAWRTAKRGKKFNHGDTEARRPEEERGKPESQKQDF